MMTKESIMATVELRTMAQGQGGKNKYKDFDDKDYTPLNTSRAKIVSKIKNEPFFERPLKIKVFAR